MFSEEFSSHRQKHNFSEIIFKSFCQYCTRQFKLDEQISDLSNLKEFDFIKDLKYYSVIESNLILSDDIGSIEEIIFQYESGNSLIYNEKFIEFNKSIPAKNSSYELFKINNPDEKMPFWFKTINVRDSINYVTYFSKTLSKESEKKIQLIKKGVS